jgi:hypothetical protein
MKKQTAVDLLRDRLFKEFGFVYSDNIHDELKEIEKQQIIDAVDGYPLDKRHLEGEQYYNETYE